MDNINEEASLDYTTENHPIPPLEIYIREQAMRKNNFPNENIIEEFLNSRTDGNHGLTSTTVRERKIPPQLSNLIVSSFLVNLKSF